MNLNNSFRQRGDDMSEESYKEKYEELKKEYDKLYHICARLIDKIEYKEFLLEEYTKHNARGAGRKSKFSLSEIIHMKILHERGQSTREIAKQFNCSHSTVYKLITKQKENSKNDLKPF